MLSEYQFTLGNLAACQAFFDTAANIGAMVLAFFIKFSLR
jgi:hypothetical protein